MKNVASGMKIVNRSLILDRNFFDFTSMIKFINELEGIVCWPKKKSDKQIVIEWLSSKFQFEKKYSEKEVNNIIEAHHSFNDIALLRRELISKRLLNREDDGSVYWKLN